MDPSCGAHNMAVTGPLHDGYRKDWQLICSINCDMSNKAVLRRSSEVSLLDYIHNPLYNDVSEWECCQCPPSWVSQAAAISLRGIDGLNIMMNVRI